MLCGRMRMLAKCAPRYYATTGQQRKSVRRLPDWVAEKSINQEER